MYTGADGPLNTIARHETVLASRELFYIDVYFSKAARQSPRGICRFYIYTEPLLRTTVLINDSCAKLFPLSRASAFPNYIMFQGR